MFQTHQPTRRIARVLMAGALVCATAAPAWALTDAEKCELAKLKASRVYVTCRVKADEKAIKKAEPADYTKCDAKVAASFEKAELKHGAECLESGDVASVQVSLTDETVYVRSLITGDGALKRITLTPQEICTTAINYHGIATNSINPDYCNIAGDSESGPTGRFDEALCDVMKDFGGCTSVCVPTAVQCPDVSTGALLHALGF